MDIEQLYDELEIIERAKKDLEFRLHSLGDESAMTDISKCDDAIVAINFRITALLDSEPSDYAKLFGTTALAYSRIHPRYDFRKS